MACGHILERVDYRKIALFVKTSPEQSGIIHPSTTNEEITMKTLGFGFIALWIAGIIGWIMNIVAMFGEISTNELIIRAIGVFIAPAGSIMGWFM